MVGILDEGRVVRVGLGHKNVFGEILVVSSINTRFGARCHPHAHKKGGEIASAYGCGRACGLIRSGDVETVHAGGVWWLADIEDLFHIFEAGRYLMFAPNFSDGGAGVADLAGEDKRVPIASATELVAGAGEVAKDNDWEEFVVLRGGQRGRQAQLGKIGANLPGISSLTLVVAGKRIAQLQ